MTDAEWLDQHGYDFDEYEFSERVSKIVLDKIAEEDEARKRIADEMTIEKALKNEKNNR